MNDDTKRGYLQAILIGCFAGTVVTVLYTAYVVWEWFNP